jgi:large subunit ribosomal protein L12e
MPPKAVVDPTEKKYIYMKVVGGEVAAAAALAPKCSPLGLPPKKVGEDIQKATLQWKGIKIFVEVMVQNRICFVTVLPTASPLVLQALKEPPRDRKKVKNPVHNGKIKFDDVIEIAKKMRPKSFSASFKGTVKEILGTCVSIGCTVDGEHPTKIQEKIDNGEIEVGNFA